MAWSGIVGQDIPKRLFRMHLATGRVASAYLLAGPEGVGKRRLALELAKALNCAAEHERPCDTCNVCRQIDRHVHPDVHALAPTGASAQIKIDDVRHVLSRVAMRPFSARTHVVIIERADRLTEEAANSLLKTLEEPTASTRFVLTTTQVADCLATIVSRCQLIRCQPLPAPALRQLLVQTQRLEVSQAEVIARLAQGNAAYAVALAAHWADYQRLIAQFAHAAPAAWLAAPLPQTPDELLRLLDVMMAWLRDVAVTAACRGQGVRATDQTQALQQQARVVDLDRCVEAAFELVALRESVEQFVSPRLVAALAREKWLSLQYLSDHSRQTTDDSQRP